MGQQRDCTGYISEQGYRNVLRVKKYIESSTLECLFVVISFLLSPVLHYFLEFKNFFITKLQLSVYHTCQHCKN